MSCSDKFAFALAVTAIASIAVGNPVSAQSSSAAPETVSRTVSYGDLNLDNASGAKILLARIRRAAKTVCGNPPEDIFDGRQQFRTCVETTTTKAVRHLGSPLVSAMNDGTAPVVLAAKR